jgi:hypothetical protein
MERKYRRSSTGEKLSVMGLSRIHPAMTRKGMTKTEICGVDFVWGGRGLWGVGWDVWGGVCWGEGGGGLVGEG